MPSTLLLHNLKEFYELYSGSILSYLQSVSGNRQLAEDLTGETFYRAMLAIDNFREESSAKTWLIRIARNLYLRCMEREKRKISLEEVYGQNRVLATKEYGPEAQLLQQFL